MGKRPTRRQRIAASILVIGALGTWQLTNSRKYQVFGEIHARVDTKEKVVALTFDDGPSTTNTPALLEMLAKHEVKATFFMVGKNVDAHRELAANALAAGHELGNHSYSHVRLVFRSPSFVEQEIDRTDAVLRELGVKGDILFRAPFGKKLLVLPWVLARTQRKDILFDVVPGDYATQDPDLIMSRTLEATRPGSIIDLHDGGPPKPGTVEAAERIIESLKAEGYRFVTVSELLNVSVQR